MLGLLGDAIVAVLLIATIAYAAVLNARLAGLRGDRAKLEELIRGLTVAVDRADAGVAGLKAAAEDVGTSLEKKIEEGRALRDDLSYMLERGGFMADRLEGTLRARREGAMNGPTPAAAQNPAPASAPAPERRREPKLDLPGRGPAAHEPKRANGAAAAAPSRAERELLRALSGR